MAVSIPSASPWLTAVVLALPWPLWYLGAWRMQQCAAAGYAGPQQLHAAAAAAAALSLQHQQRLQFPLVAAAGQRHDRDDVIMDDDVSDLTSPPQHATVRAASAKFMVFRFGG